MNLHEYQAKELLAKYGLRVQTGILATNEAEAGAAFDKLGGKFAVVKAQVHARIYNLRYRVYADILVVNMRLCGFVSVCV